MRRMDRKVGEARRLMAEEGLSEAAAAKRVGLGATTFAKRNVKAGLRTRLPKQMTPPEKLDALKTRLRELVPRLMPGARRETLPLPRTLADELGVSRDAATQLVQLLVFGLERTRQFEEAARLAWHTNRPAPNLFPGPRYRRYYLGCTANGRRLLREVFVLAFVLRNRQLLDSSRKRMETLARNLRLPEGRRHRLEYLLEKQRLSYEEQRSFGQRLAVAVTEFNAHARRAGKEPLQLRALLMGRQAFGGHGIP